METNINGMTESWTKLPLKNIIMALVIGKASTVTTFTEGGRTIDSVSLNLDGSVTKDGKTIEAGSDGAFNNAAGSTHVKQKEVRFLLHLTVR